MTDKKMITVPGISYDEDGTLVINSNDDAAKSDPIRAARLKRSKDPKDQEKLRELENTPMLRQDGRT